MTEDEPGFDRTGFVECLDCGYAYGEYEHLPGDHYDPTKYPCCCAAGCDCGSDEGWGFCRACVAELFQPYPEHSTSHEDCSPYKGGQ